MGTTEIRIPPLALSTWSMAGRRGPWSGTLSAEEVERAYHELGINAFLVTPKMKGLAEGVRRLVRSGHRDQIVIMSGVAVPTAGRVRSYWRSCTAALETDRIDLYLMGWVQARWYLRPRVWGALQQLKNEGRVGALGFSIHNRKLAASLSTELDPGPDFLMIRYNAAHRGAETDIFDRLPDPPPRVIAYTATRWGDLLKPRPDQGFERGMSAPECYRFALTHPAVTTVLCGARTWQELQEDVAGVRQGPLARDRLEEIRRFGDAVHASPMRRSAHFMFDR